MSLHQLAKEGKTDELLIKLSSNPQRINAQDEIGCTVLHYACIHGNRETVRALIENSADIDLKNHDGMHRIQTRTIKKPSLHKMFTSFFFNILIRF
jgi:ankyrin repeat protein